MVAEERIVHAVLLPRSWSHRLLRRAPTAVELVAILVEGIPPTYQVLVTRLDGRRLEASRLIDHPYLASREFHQKTKKWIPTKNYEEIVSGRSEGEV